MAAQVEFAGTAPKGGPACATVPLLGRAGTLREAALSGGCFCGRVRFTVTEPVRNCCFCHCESCRRATGSAPVAWGTVNECDFKILSGEVSMYRSSPEAERGFCSTCGTSLTYRHALRIGEVDFTLVSLDAAEGFVPQMHIWVQDKLPWVHIGDGRPQFETVAGQMAATDANDNPND
jgi:hypothetical protein